MEMVKGFQQVQRPQNITDLLTYVAGEDLLDFRQPEAELAGRIWGDLDRTGQPIGLADPMIAAKITPRRACPEDRRNGREPLDRGVINSLLFLST
jgi:predicted nucleic acid-binding protein